MLRFNSLNDFVQLMKSKVSTVSSETLGWLSVIVLHAATIPSMLAVMSGLTDRLPAIDLVLLVWAGLGLIFIKSVVNKDMLILVTIGLGFMVQASMMALIFFK